MHILLASAGPWAVSDDLFTPWTSTLTRVDTGLDDLFAQLRPTPPDIIFIGDLPQHDLIAAIIGIRELAPKAAIIPYCANPVPDVLLQLMRLGINEVLTDLSPGNIGEMIERVGNAQAMNAAGIAPSIIGKTVRRFAFVATKGGAGATLLLANFAMSLAKAANSRVLLIDLSLPFGDLDIHLTSQAITHDLADLVEEVDRLDQALFKAMVHHLNDRVDLIPCPQVFERVMRVTPANVAQLVDQVSEYYDYVLFDFGSVIDPLKLPILEKLDQLTLIATLDVPSARRTSQMFTLLDHLDFPMVRTNLVANRVGPRPSITPDELEKAVGKTVAYRFPEVAAGVTEALAQGMPLVELQPRSKFAAEMNDWVAALLKTPRKGRSLWQRLKSK